MNKRKKIFKISKIVKIIFTVGKLRSIVSKSNAKELYSRSLRIGHGRTGFLPLADFFFPGEGYRSGEEGKQRDEFKSRANPRRIGGWQRVKKTRVPRERSGVICICRWDVRSKIGSAYSSGGDALRPT